jgi:exodeoxyribonuclease VIII
MEVSPLSEAGWAGLVYGMPSEDYHARQALGSSTLKKMMKTTPWHAWKLGLDPQRPASEPSDAMKAGTLCHTAVLEPDTLNARYAVRPEGLDGRTKDGKVWLNEQRRFGREVITFEQMEVAFAQARAVREQLPEVAELLDGPGHSEVSAFWTREAKLATGEVVEVACKCRPDRVCEVEPRSVVLLDLKTAKDASDDGFGRAVGNYGYELQAAWYQDGYETAADVLVMATVLVAVESNYPHACSAYVIDDNGMREAREDIDKLVKRFAMCQRSGVWPAYPSGVRALSLPPWRRRA